MTTREPLTELLRYLKSADYRFVTVTPATHSKVLARAVQGPSSLREIFGWNRPFEPGDLSPDLIALLEAADALERHNGQLRSRVRVASLGDDLLLHSAFPTESPDSVFFGPDTYRFVRFVQQQLPRRGNAEWLVDMGSGSGAGAIGAARLCAARRVTLVDVNARALKLAALNAESAGIRTETSVSDVMPCGADLIVANPPFMMDAAARAYRDGGDLWGGAVSLNWVMQALACLVTGGTMLLYTGAAYVDGEAPLLKQMENACADAGASIEIDEIDPDIFGEELTQPSYSRVQRIAAIGAVISV